MQWCDHLPSHFSWDANSIFWIYAKNVHLSKYVVHACSMYWTSARVSANWMRVDGAPTHFQRKLLNGNKKDNDFAHEMSIHSLGLIFFPSVGSAINAAYLFTFPAPTPIEIAFSMCMGMSNRTACSQYSFIYMALVDVYYFLHEIRLRYLRRVRERQQTFDIKIRILFPFGGLEIGVDERGRWKSFCRSRKRMK